MEVEYELAVSDMAALHRFNQKHAPKLKSHPLMRLVSMGFQVVLIALLALIYWFSAHPQRDWISGCCSGMILGILITLALNWLKAWLQLKITLRNVIPFYWDREECRWYFARRRLKIDTHGLEITNQFQHVRYSWSVVWLIDSTDKHTFFYVTMNQAHIIPRRAFQKQRDFEAFVDLACHYHKGLARRKATSTAILDALPAEQTGITRSRHP